MSIPFVCSGKDEASLKSTRRHQSKNRPVLVCNGSRCALLLVVVLSVLALWTVARGGTIISSKQLPMTSGFRISKSEGLLGTKLTVVLLSDTHGRHREINVPNGDLLIHAGDFTKFGNRRHALDFNDWLGGLPHRNKVVVAGNHDGPGSFGRFAGAEDGNDNDSESIGGSSVPPVSLSDLPPIITNAHYLEDSGFSFPFLQPRGRGDNGNSITVNVWGSPWQPQFRGFETYRAAGPDIAGRWAAIPDNTTILVTHTPPAGVMDGGGRGCVDLAERIDRLRQQQRQMHEVKMSADAGIQTEGLPLPALRLAAFGHFHEHGIVQDGPLTYVNCAVTDNEYIVRKSPRVITVHL